MDILLEIWFLVNYTLRASDIFGRYGGEEFLIICPKTTKENTLVLAEKLRTIVKTFEFDEVGYKTVSIGISDFQKDDTIETLFRKADEALYEVKNSGRDKCVVYGTDKV